MVLTIILILILIMISIMTNPDKKKFFQCEQSISTNSLYHEVLRSNGVTRTKKGDWNLFLPCNNGYDDRSIQKIQVANPGQSLFIISQNGSLGSKESLWRLLVSTYGRVGASKIMPNSYIFPEDTAIFTKDYSPSKYYMAKSEAQRQKGLKLTNDFNEIVGSRANGFKIVQEYIVDPLTYRGYKLNFRIYLFIICKSGQIDSFVYNDGIISYAENPYNKDQVDFSQGVSSFYTSGKLYDKGFPIIMSQMRSKLLPKFIESIKKVVIAAKTSICKMHSQNKSFQLFGVDFMVTESGKAYLLEINIGPGMTPHNSVDKRMRFKMLDDILALAGLKNKSKTDFIRV